MEKEAGIPGGIYHKVQIELTYNSNHMEGSRLTHDQTRYIFETNTIGIQDEVVNVDDIVETVNHFRCIDQIIELANYNLSEAFIKQLHYILKSGTSDSRKTWFAVGEYKRFENEVGGSATAKPADVSGEMRNLLSRYNLSKQKTLKRNVSSQIHNEIVLFPSTSFVLKDYICLINSAFLRIHRRALLLRFLRPHFQNVYIHQQQTTFFCYLTFLISKYNVTV